MKSQTIVTLGRLGYAAKGVVYLVSGLLTAALAFQLQPGKVTGTEEALGWIESNPFGTALLALVALGLAGYSLWRLAQAWRDPEHHGSDFKGLAIRAGYVASAVIYAFLCYSAVKIMTRGGGGGGDSTPEATATAMNQPFGYWIVGLAGVIIIGVGLYHLYDAFAATFMKRLRTAEMSAAERTWAERVGRAGMGARGVVFGVIGAFLLLAAVNANPGLARGLSGALKTLNQLPYGQWLMGLVALGLACYGVFSGFNARYRRIAVP